MSEAALKAVPAKGLNLYQRILAVISESGAIAKTGRADARFGGYAFHKIDDVVEHLRPILVKHGVVMLVSVEDHQDLQGTEKMPFRAVERLKIRLVNADNPDEFLEGWSVGEGLDNSDKASGKATSYGLKNWAMANFQLRGQPDNEDEKTDPGARKALDERLERETSPKGKYQLTPDEQDEADRWMNYPPCAEFVVSKREDGKAFTMQDVMTRFIAKGAKSQKQVADAFAECRAKWGQQ